MNDASCTRLGPASVAGNAEWNNLLALPLGSSSRTGKRRFRFLAAIVFVAWLVTATETQAQVTRSFTEPVQFSNVAASEPGILQAIHVREGDRVSVGQTLAELDNQVLQQSLQIAILQAESNAKVRSAEANLRVFQQKYDKLKPLLEAGHANTSEVEIDLSEY